MKSSEKPQKPTETLTENEWKEIKDTYQGLGPVAREGFRYARTVSTLSAKKLTEAATNCQNQIYIKSEIDPTGEFKKGAEVFFGTETGLIKKVLPSENRQALLIEKLEKMRQMIVKTHQEETVTK